MTVAENIKRIRKEKGLTQKQLGDLCTPKMAESTIRQYELGFRNPKLETIQKIADALHVPIFELLDIKETMNLANLILKNSTSEHELDVAEKVAQIAERKYNEEYPLEVRLKVIFDELTEQEKEKVLHYAENIIRNRQ